MAANGARTQAWKDTLTTHELEQVDRIEGMPTDMRAAFVLVEMLRGSRRPVWRALTDQAGAFVGGAAAAVAAITQSPW